MADLTDIQSAQTVKIAGATSTGSENNFVSATTNNEILAADISNNGGVQGALTIGTSALLAAVGGTNLANRKTLTIFNNSNSTIYWGHTNAVTTSTGTPIFKNQFAVFSYGPNTDVYLIAGSAGNNVRVTENA